MSGSSDHNPKAAANIRQHFNQLERRFQAGLVMMFFLPLLALSIYFHIQFDVTLKETGKLNLAAIAESQRNTVDLFLQERVVNIFSLFHSREFTLSPTQLQMQQFLQQLRQVSDAFIDVGFLNAEGLQIGYAGPFPYLQNKDYSSQDWFNQLMQRERNHYISDIYLGFRNKLHFTIAARQVIDGRPYVLRSTLDPDKFYLFLRTINHGQGVESFIVNTAGRFQLADPARWQALSSSPFVPPSTSVSGVREIEKNGDSALVAYAWLKESEWALVVSEPLRLAYSQFYRARRIMLISTAVVTLVFIIAIWLSTLPSIMVDLDQVRQVLVNLLNNACDAMDGPGCISVKSRMRDGNIRLTITDTGHGMDTEQIEKIFDPFYTTKEVGKGTGLGLSVSLGIIESMGGTISVQSMPEAGSAFTVMLPIDQKCQPKKERTR